MKWSVCWSGLAVGWFVAQVAFAPVSAGAGDWPQWRGPNRDGIGQETGLLREWPKDGPKVLWRVDSVGVGYSSMSLKDGRLFTQGDLDGVEHVLALDAATGKTLWSVQPAPVLSLLAEKLASEMKGLDRNKDGEVDEFEALSRFSWEFTRFDKPAPGDVEARAKSRAATDTRTDSMSDSVFHRHRACPGGVSSQVPSVHPAITSRIAAVAASITASKEPCARIEASS